MQCQPYPQGFQRLLTFKAEGKGSWKAAGDEELAVSFAMPANFTASLTALPRYPHFFW